MTISVPKMHTFSDLSILLLSSVLRNHVCNDIYAGYSVHYFYWYKTEGLLVK